MMIKRYLMLAVPFLILAWIAARLGRGLENGDELFWFHLLMGGVFIAQGIWRPQLDRYLHPEKSLDDGWGYQWSRVLFIFIGIGWIADAFIDLVRNPGDPRTSVTFLMLALAFILNPVFHAIAVRSSGEAALLHETLGVIGVALFGLAILVLVAIDAITRWITFTAFLAFAPSLLLFLAAYIVQESWHERQAHPDMPPARSTQDGE
jgi:hypothetical protein